MSLYKRGDVWWYKFRFAGQVIRESTKSDSRTVARSAEHARRRELEQGFNRIERHRAAQLFNPDNEVGCNPSNRSHTQLGFTPYVRANAITVTKVRLPSPFSHAASP
jgi:hypothetical protein